MIPENFTEFYGDQIRWFTGIVVNINDPLQMGRVQIRAHGIHSEDPNQISESELPWAQVMAPITQGGTGSAGNFLGLQPNARVVGLFLDGKNSQVPLVLGTLPKYESSSDGGSNINPLAKGEQKFPADVSGLCVSVEDPYAAEYPHNKVYETEGGHVKEYDDTPGSERIRERHVSGTFYQMNPDGDHVTHVVKDRYSIIAGNDYLAVNGTVRICAKEFFLEAETGDIIIDGVSLVNHQHQDNPGLAPGITTPPIKE